MQLPLTQISQQYHSQAIAVESKPELNHYIAQWQFKTPRPTLVIVGGAGGIAEEDCDTLQQLFIDCVAPWAEAHGLAVVDGGTDAGIMRFIGVARETIQGTFPLIGVVAEGTVNLPEHPGTNPYAAELEPHHSHFVLVPGEEWGDESPWLAGTATAIAAEYPSVTFVINGGNITWQDIECSIDENRPVVTFAGSGRTADILAETLKGNEQNERAEKIIERGKIHAISMHTSPSDLQVLLADLFGISLTQPEA
ncbi:hypothetical protein Lepto7376_3227 [[Leptolyngbya] sp. PCC 7376]|uniref:hypothetical protein n=1 Tax=[Leptolyngbya] sp. PCC 7376 TaxID=111781 RepID=UPI00029F3356|nr:hypothetical protein [[Leptolyngbya] sp. PCC 7376]AFY39455.1 hypothetical protein Lepto7376_3227 [[Leptolyngbya] sp. PCC 7376]